MKTKIKLFAASLFIIAGVFGGTGIASAQTATTATCNGATLQGTLTSTGGSATTVWFEWGTNATTVDAGNGIKTGTQTFNSPQDFSQNISGLSANTTYYYRAVFSNASGISKGATRTITTPTCGSSVGGESSQTTIGTCRSATVYGDLTSTGGSATTVYFEWGTSSSQVSSGAGARTSSQTFNSPQGFSSLITGLNPSTTYYYRAVFTNAYGRTDGSVRSFNTAACATTTPPPVTPPTVYQPQVTTSGATSLSQNGGVINGYVTPNGANTNAWFEWGTTYSLGNQTASISYGTGATNYSHSLSGLSANTTYYYRAVAQNSAGTVYGNTLSFTTTAQQATSQLYVATNNPSSVSQNSATLNGYVTSNGNNTNTWFEWGTSYSLGNTTTIINSGNNATSFNFPLYNLSVNTTYYYRAVAQGLYSPVYGNIVSFTTTGSTYTPPISYPYGVAPTVTTLLASELTGSTARLNGLVTTSNTQSSSAWFEWGTSVNLGNKTQTINVGSLPVVRHSDYITGLVEGQTYYYRIVAENSSGRVPGAVSSFVARTYTYVAPRPTNNTNTVVLRPTTTVITTGGQAQSLVMLTIDGGVEMIGAGEKRTYHVKWKNESNQSLKNVVLQVTFPASMQIVSATKGSYSSSDNSVVVDLKTLAPQEQGEAFIFVTTSMLQKSGDVLVVVANMVYTSASDIQGDAIAYVMHRAEMIQNFNSATVLGAGAFVPGSLFEWLLLIILILILVLLANHLYGRFSGDRREH